MKTLHLVCNAHLDPVWLWEWEEGAAEALGTFRVAADFCEQYDGFVFNHNEVILYQWVEAYEPALFKRIQRLVKEKRWHIMGGWYLQPDCNMPSGESFVRQILLGRRYFKAKFGVSPTAAINFDSFGHTRGLVQVMAKSGFDAYLFCRPGPGDCPLPAEEFSWEGYDGSRVLATRATDHYLSARGAARAKAQKFIDRRRDDLPAGILLWGVGNHGGGPSHVDVKALAGLMRDTPEINIRHSTPEAYFKDLKRRGNLPVHRGDLNPWAVGCYTSQVKIKRNHRLLENTMFATEKMVTAAWGQGLMEYPGDDLGQAEEDLAISEFHDILPGSAIEAVETTSIRVMHHGLELLSRIKAQAFFALAHGQKRAKDGEVPILVYNPHPFAITTTVECEFQLADQNWEDSFTLATVHANGTALPTQVEDEASNLNLDWRKRVVFTATLAPSQMNRFDCRLKRLPAKPAPKLTTKKGQLRFRTKELDVVINTRTGLIDRYRVNGVDHLQPQAGRLLVMADNADPWGMTVQRFRTPAGAFKLLSAKEAARVSGLPGRGLAAVRVIEDGDARTVVEAIFGYGDSFACQRYRLPRTGTEIEVETRVNWNEKDRMLKLALPTPNAGGRYVGQVAYGADTLPANGDEAVAQKWVAAVSADRKRALTVVNEGVYGSDCADGEIRMSLLRSPAYSGHPIGDRPIVPEDRFTPRIDQGEFVFRLWLNAGPATPRLNAIDREALVRNEEPMALSFFPSGQGAKPKPLVTLSDEVVQVTTVKRAERGDAIVIRLFEPTGRARSTTVSLPFARMKKTVKLGKFEIRTYRVDIRKRTWTAVDLVEKPLA